MQDRSQNDLIQRCNSILAISIGYNQPQTTQNNTRMYPGEVAGMLRGSPQRECCDQEHVGRGCPHKRSGGC